MEIIGKLDRRITIQSATFADDTFGEEIPTFTDLVSVWAKVTPLKASEDFDAEQLTSRRTLKFKIRYRKDLNTENRISYQGDFYDILSITEIGRRCALEINAEAIELEDTEARHG